MKNNFKVTSNENKTYTLTLKLWGYFVFFAISIFVILWFMQVILLQSYYSSMKKAEVSKLVEQIERNYDEENIKDIIDSIAYKNASSIFVYDLDENIKYSTSTNLSNQVPTRPLIVEKITGIVEKILKSSSDKVSYTFKDQKFKSEIYVYGKLIKDKNVCIVMVTSIDPIDSTISVLQSQLVYVTIMALIISSIVSIFLSKRISKPITKITQNARKMAIGNFDVKFEKAGYTEIDELADTLNFTANELAKTDKIRKELIANVSHDLRTPLTMIKAYSEMIRDLSGDNKQKREEHLQVIIDETDRLTRLVNDMMDMSKIESGLTVLEKEKFCYTDIVQKIVDNFKLVHEGENCSFEVDMPKDIYVLADKTKIERVLFNLISNAINHSGKDEQKKIIKIKVTSNTKFVKTEVIDNGIGIKQEDIKHIWDRYYKVNKNFKRSDTGSGLGLSIVKDILIAHNCNYGVKSKENEGANFWFELYRANKPKEVKNKAQDSKEKE